LPLASIAHLVPDETNATNISALLLSCCQRIRSAATFSVIKGQELEIQRGEQRYTKVHLRDETSLEDNETMVLEEEAEGGLSLP
jgi:hypothetical protein